MVPTCRNEFGEFELYAKDEPVLLGSGYPPPPGYPGPAPGPGGYGAGAPGYGAGGPPPGAGYGIPPGAAGGGYPPGSPPGYGPAPGGGPSGLTGYDASIPGPRGYAGAVYPGGGTSGGGANGDGEYPGVPASHKTIEVYVITSEYLGPVILFLVNQCSEYSVTLE